MAYLSAEYEQKQTKFTKGDELAGVKLSWYLTDYVPRSKTTSYLIGTELKLDNFLTSYEQIWTEFTTGDELTKVELSWYLTDQVQRGKPASYLTRTNLKQGQIFGRLLGDTS